MTTREKHLVELVDDAGRPRGETTVSAAHQAPGQLHRAFSVLLVDPDGRVLLQRRAPVKTRFPLRWANACCGHPAPGESLVEAANRRLREELGAGPVELTEVGVYVYYAEDPATGRIEFEYDHVLRGGFQPGDPLLPDPDEVAELRWVDPVALLADIDTDPRPYAPWLGGVVDRLLHPAGPTVGPPDPVGPPPNDAPERSGGR
ncbi:isopentenyl-diphosphate Delta-isomerase [Micromonospora sp. NPDC049051]|uniref:isopentenyl-diphosphate Delta-isomerase n=1 Tax=unclassified Micromonospora TaxID=2617518 RepID=UPI00371338F1